MNIFDTLARLDEHLYYYKPNCMALFKPGQHHFFKLTHAHAEILTPHLHPPDHCPYLVTQWLPFA